jgi:hypothetical protein
VTRDEAIAWFNDRGYLARPYGAGIFAAQLPVEIDGIRVMMNGLEIRPIEAGWEIFEGRFGGGCRTHTFASLEEAIVAAREWIDVPPPWPDDSESAK